MDSGINNDTDVKIAGRIISQNGVGVPNQRFYVYNGEDIKVSPVYTSDRAFLEL